MYSSVETWHSWMKDYRFGTLALIPDGSLRETVDQLRQEYDPESAQTSMAHITLTQPFAKAPAEEELTQIYSLIAEFAKFKTTIGPAITSPKKKLLWLDVGMKEEVLALREVLHATGLFRTDLPLTKGFIPHMTISEVSRDPAEVTEINAVLNERYQPWPMNIESVAWIIPSDNFVFGEHMSFPLG